MNKFAPFIKWLWSKRGEQYAFGEDIFTVTNTDRTLPRPPLSPLDSFDLLRFLEKREVVFLRANGGYLINKVESHKWKSLLFELWLPEWMHLAWVRLLGIIVLGVMAGFTGGYMESMGERASELTIEKMKESSAQTTAECAKHCDPEKVEVKKQDEAKAATKAEPEKAISKP